MAVFTRFNHYLYNAKIRSKLIVYVALPLVVILSLCSIETYVQVKKWRLAQASERAVYLSINISALIHELQKERGITEGYLGNPNEKSLQKVLNTRLKTDAKYDILTSYVYNQYLIEHGENEYFTNLSQNFENLALNIDDLVNVRASIENGTSINSFEFYTELIVKLIQIVTQTHTEIYGEDQIHSIIAYTLLLELQEKSGLERGTLNGTFSSESLTYFSDLQNTVRWGDEQSLLINKFLNISSREHTSLLQSQLSSQVEKEVAEVRKYISDFVYRLDKISEFKELVKITSIFLEYKALVNSDATDLKIRFNEKIDSLLNYVVPITSQYQFNLQEKNAIKTILNTVTQYKLETNKELQQSVDNLKLVDDNVKLLEAYKQLSAEPIIFDNDYWWKIATKRIENFKSISDSIAQDMIDKARSIKQNALVTLVTLLSIVLLTLLISIHFSHLVLTRIITGIEKIVASFRNMGSSGNYQHLLEIDGEDEIAQMAQSLNQLLQARNKSESLLRTSAEVFEYASEAIIITDEHVNIKDVNNAFTHITGYEKSEVIGKNPRILQSGRHDAQFYQLMWKKIIEEGAWQGEIWNRRKNGEIYPEYLSISAVKNEHGEPYQYISLFSDVTKLKQQEQDIWYQANYDALTNLPNRKHFIERVDQEITRSIRSAKEFSVMFVDIDRFKYINDSLGHSLGDKLLILVSQRMKGCLRKSDVAARFGGDEFVVLLTNISEEHDTRRVAKALIECFEKPFEVVEGSETIISASIGISIYPHDGENAETLIRNADTAMYQVKEDGKNAFNFFEQSMNDKVIAHMKLEQELRKATKADEFILHYQPVLCLKSGQIVGLEALVRWQHPVKGLIYPDVFIPMAEETLLIDKIGDFVLTKAIADVTRLHQLGFYIHVAVNVSNRQKKIADKLNKALLNSKLDPQYLKIEITESLLMDNSEKTFDEISSIRALGVEVYMDDFGTGYSSLSYLKNFPIDVLKIDRAFIMQCVEDEIDASLVKAIILIANSLNINVVAEGIEDEQQLNFLKSLSCQFGQGYFISKPIPLAELQALLVNKC